MPIITTKDGRTIRKKGSYAVFRFRIYQKQDGNCYLCSSWCPYELFQVHHQGERGMGGSRRNDRYWFEVHKGNQLMVKGLCYGLCIACHRSVDKKVLFWSKQP